MQTATSTAVVSSWSVNQSVSQSAVRQTDRQTDRQSDRQTDRQSVTSPFPLPCMAVNSAHHIYYVSPVPSLALRGTCTFYV